MPNVYPSQINRAWSYIQLRPFKTQASRKYDSFPAIASDPLHDLDMQEFTKWLERHKKNLLYHAPIEEE